VAKVTSAGRYAQAVFEIALEKNELDGWQTDLSRIAAMGEDKEFAGLIENPRVPFSDKQKLLSAGFGDAGPLVLNLVYLLITRNSIDMLGQIADEYRKLLDSHRGIEQAEVTTAVPLDEGEIKKLEEDLGALVGKNVVIRPEVDPALMVGITARVGGKLIDGSTRSRLERLKKQIGGERR
jgi:F-type H+-transporting ATPase subunit delta